MEDHQFNCGPDPQGPLFFLGIVVAAIAIPSYFSDTAQLSFALLLFPLLILLALAFFSEAEGDAGEELQHHHHHHHYRSSPPFYSDSWASSSSSSSASFPAAVAVPAGSFPSSSSSASSSSSSSQMSFSWLLRYAPLLFFSFFFIPWSVACFLFLFLFVSMAK